MRLGLGLYGDAFRLGLLTLGEVNLQHPVAVLGLDLVRLDSHGQRDTSVVRSVFLGAVVDRAADTLARKIKQHKESVRKDYIFKRKQRARMDISAAGPLLQRDREIGRREDFFRLLRPLLGFLRDYARRELRILELEGTILELEGTLHRGQVTLADLLDEVLSRAWQRFPVRPKRLSLDLWLIELLHEVLESWVKQEPRPHLSLDEQASERTVSVGEQEWWAALLGYDESFTLADLIPSSQGTEAWEQLAGEDQLNRLLSVLADLPGPQRQAFLLHALEDYDLAEIAMLQDRSESQVKADIEAARRALKERLLASGHVDKFGRLAATTAS